MGKKTYLSNQIKLITLNTYDLFTDDEFNIYSKIVELKRQLDIGESKKNMMTKEQKAKITSEKSALAKELAEKIRSNTSTRTVRLKSVIDTKKWDDNNPPQGITWWNLKTSRKIAEFSSEESRALGLNHLDICLDKIIIKWKSIDLLKQIVLNGFYCPRLNEDGTVENKHYSVITASAGQLRTDKVQCLADEAWNRIKDRIQCGMTWDIINECGGINVNKIMAYLALPCSATDEWTEFDIDRAIVIKDFEAPVTGMMQYIKPDYTSIRGERTVSINHCDGIGMMLPSVSRINFMVRAPWIKGLLTPFDYLKFCEVNHVPAKITDFWGKEHDLIEENIQIIFTESQFKLAKYYKSWDEYKKNFIKYNCKCCRTNYEETFIQDSDLNYQFLQTLKDFNDDEIDKFIKPSKEKIENLAKDIQTMQRTLGADENSDSAYKKALYLYPELLREAYSKETLKAIKKKWILNARSGSIKTRCKRLFVIPDMYAACEYWFCHIKEPVGLLKVGEVACAIYRNHEKLDILRSPHLYMEHSIQTVSNNPIVYDWFQTNGVYTSCHDLISRVLQFDVDGDMLVCVADKLLISIAERNIDEYNIVPLFYDANKAEKEMLSRETMFNGLKRAHDFSGIGAVSNNLTKLWNKDDPDYAVAAWLCFYNNLVIDAAKTGKISSYEDIPEVKSRVSKATGGKTGKMPWFFQYTKNGRSESAKIKSYAKQNSSTMNRLCAKFDKTSRINMNFSGLAPFNWQMMIDRDDYPYNEKAVLKFCELDDSNLVNIIMAQNDIDATAKSNSLGYGVLAEVIEHELESICTKEIAYSSVLKYLFTGDNIDKSSHKQMFWRVFGDMAIKHIKENLQNYTVCDKCNAKIPAWAKHTCSKDSSGFFACVDCGAICERTGPRQCRCDECSTKHRELYIAEKRKVYKARRMK